MSNHFQLIVFKRVLAFFFAVVNFIGLWPFKFHRNHRQIRYSYPKALYSVFVLCFGLASYSIIGAYVFGLVSQTYYFATFTMKLTAIVYAQSVMISLFFVYISQNINSRKIEITYSKCKEAIDTISEAFSKEFSNFWVLFIDFMFKALVYEICQAYLSVDNFSRFPTNWLIKPYFILLFPQIAIRLYMNTFYVAILMCNEFFKQLNKCLLDVADRAEIIRSEKGPWIITEEFCYLSDQVDKLSTIHCRLTEAIKSLNSIFSFNITVWYLIIVLALIIQCLLLFVTIIQTASTRIEFYFLQNVYGFCFISFTFYDIFTTSYVCERLVNEVS